MFSLLLQGMEVIMELPLHYFVVRWANAENLFHFSMSQSRQEATNLLSLRWRKYLVVSLMLIGDRLYHSLGIRDETGKGQNRLEILIYKT